MTTDLFPGFTIITPLHAPANRFIHETFRRLTELHTRRRWEWIICENRGGQVPKAIKKDPRVRVIRSEPVTVGALKRQLTLAARAPWIVELDADDFLHPDALLRLEEAFTAGADFVYSNTVEFHDGTWAPNTYSKEYGWRHRAITFEDHALIETRAFAVTPHTIRYVYWAPNHVRAWTGRAYELAGGHDETLEFGDDHDLICRFFFAGKRFVHIDEPLYFYRVHADNAVKLQNPKIQAATNQVYNKYLWKLAEKWSDAEGLSKVDLGGALDCPPGYLPLDKRRTIAALGFRCDLNRRWPLGEGSVGVLRAHDILEHLRDPVHVMNEAYRVLAPGGWFLIMVPSTDGRGAFQDPTHVSFWNANSFWYYTRTTQARYVPEFRGRFQVSRIIDWYPSPWHERHKILYTEAHLICLKPGYEPVGEVLI